MIDDIDVLRFEPLGERADPLIMERDPPRFSQIDFAHRAAIKIDDRYRAAAVAVRRKQFAQPIAGGSAIADKAECEREARARAVEIMEFFRRYSEAAAEVVVRHLALHDKQLILLQ